MIQIFPNQLTALPRTSQPNSLGCYVGNLFLKDYLLPEESRSIRMFIHSGAWKVVKSQTGTGQRNTTNGTLSTGPRSRPGPGPLGRPSREKSRAPLGLPPYASIARSPARAQPPPPAEATAARASARAAAGPAPGCAAFPWQQDVLPVPRPRPPGPGEPGLAPLVMGPKGPGKWQRRSDEH